MSSEFFLLDRRAEGASTPCSPGGHTRARRLGPGVPSLHARRALQGTARPTERGPQQVHRTSPAFRLGALPPGSPDFLTAHREAHRPPRALPLRSTERAASGAMDSRDGIQKLLVAEQEAQAIVTAARQGTRATLGPPVVVLRPRPSREAKKHTTHTPRPPLPITERRENGEDETGEGGGRRGDRGVPRPARGHLPEDARGGARPNPPSLSASQIRRVP